MLDYEEIDLFVLKFLLELWLHLSLIFFFKNIIFTVPERLRLLLRETENDYDGRVDTLHSGEDESGRRISRVTSGLIKTETSVNKSSFNIIYSESQTFWY